MIFNDFRIIFLSGKNTNNLFKFFTLRIFFSTPLISQINRDLSRLPGRSSVGVSEWKKADFFGGYRIFSATFVAKRLAPMRNMLRFIQAFPKTL